MALFQCTNIVLYCFTNIVLCQRTNIVKIVVYRGLAGAGQSPEMTPQLIVVRGIQYSQKRTANNSLLERLGPQTRGNAKNCAAPRPSAPVHTSGNAPVPRARAPR